MTRRGTVLLVVAGCSTLVMALGLAFLLRMRVEADENQAMVRDLQARVMLMAGCDYVLECARVGYDPQPETTDPTLNPRTHAEAYGWIDVRPKFPASPDGVAPDPDVGPRDARGAQLWSDVQDTSPGDHPRWRWPRIGSAARCPMYVMRQAPYATAQTVSYNPMSTDRSDPAFGKPYLRWPDPQPPAQTPNGWPSGATDPVAAAALVNAAQYGRYGVAQSPPTFAGGDPRPRQESAGMSWFRVYRESASVFVVTCGAGGTMGFRDWDDVTFAPSHADLFGGDRALFEQILAEERRLWYRVEWCDAIGSVYIGGFIDNEIYPANYGGSGANGRDWDHWLLHPVNSMQRSGGSHRNDIFRPNQCGTIKWVQRLDGPPPPPPGDPGALSW